MSKEEKEKRQRLTESKFKDLLEGIKEKVGEEEIEKLLKNVDLDKVATRSGRGPGSGVGNIGPFYSDQETFEKVDFIVGYHEYVEDHISKNEIFKMMVDTYHDTVMKKAKDMKASKKISKLGVKLAEEREEKKLEKRRLRQEKRARQEREEDEEDNGKKKKNKSK